MEADGLALPIFTPVVGVVSGGDVTLGQGLWLGGTLPGGAYHIHLPLVIRG